MPYTETQTRGKKRYLYRVRSVRKDGKVTKQRIYLGADLPKRELARREREADRELGVLGALLTEEEIGALDSLKEEFEKEPAETSENRYEAFLALFTYDSNAIEGNTLTLEETSQLLFEGLVPAKSLREINEALNHRKAYDYLLSARGDITKRLICELHAMVVRDTLRPDLASQVGAYRTLQVYVRGVDWVPPAPKQVPKDMKALLEWYTRNKKRIHPLVVAAYFHVGFEVIHPFVDGNGRVGRLLMNFILQRNGYPMLNIPKSRRRDYYAALHAAQVDGNLRPFVSLMMDLYAKNRLRF